MLAAFARATESGDLTALVAILAPDVIAIGDGGGVAPAARRPVIGAEKVARLLIGLAESVGRISTWVRIEPALVNGDLGLLFTFGLPDGSTQAGTTAFAIDGGRITGVFNQLNPAKLTGVRA